MSYGGGGWWCCCNPPVAGCLIDSDDFDRSDNDDPGVDWSEDSGDWDIVSNKLYTEDTNGECEFQTAHPDSVEAHFVTVKVSFNTRGDKARIMLSSTLFAELEWNDDCTYPAEHGIGTYGCSTMRIYEGTSLLAILRDIVINVSEISISAGYIKADSTVWFAVYPHCLTATTNTPTGYTVGLATGDTNGGGISFNDFEFYRAKTGSYPNCPDACEETGDDYPCIIDNAFCVPDQDPIASEDISCNWTIVSGSWKGDTYTVGTDVYSMIVNKGSAGIIESNTLQSGVSVYGHMQVEMEVSASQNDVVRIYLDYNGTSDCHMAEFTFGDSSTGSGGSIKLYKDAVLLEQESYFIRSSTWTKLMACLTPAPDGSNFDIFFCDVDDQAAGGSSFTEGVLAPTSVNGNRRWAFGVGTVSTLINFKGANLYHTKTLDDSTVCADCYSEEECDPCPAGAAPKTGISFAISGFTGSPPPCDCTSADGTYNVVNAICGGSTTAFPFCTFGANYSLRVDYLITAGSGTDWVLTVSLRIIRNGVQYGGTVNYKATFTDTKLCTQLSGDALAYDSTSGTMLICGNWTGLTITATSY